MPSAATPTTPPGASSHHLPTSVIFAPCPLFPPMPASTQPSSPPSPPSNASSGDPASRPRVDRRDSLDSALAFSEASFDSDVEQPVGARRLTELPPRVALSRLVDPFADAPAHAPHHELAHHELHVASAPACQTSFLSLNAGEPDAQNLARLRAKLKGALAPRWRGFARRWRRPATTGAGASARSHGGVAMVG